MIKIPSIASLIILGSIITISKTMAMLEQEDILRANTVVKAQGERQQRIDSLNQQSEKKAIWLRQHEAAYGAGSCGGTGLLCQNGEGPCLLPVETKIFFQLRNQLTPILEEFQTKQPYILNLKNLMPQAMEETLWVRTHGQPNLGPDGNCRSPSCNPQSLFFLPGMLRCKLSEHRNAALQLRNQVVNTLDTIDSL